MSWPQPYRPAETGFSQLTTFMNGGIAIGSRNRDTFALNHETRDIIAHATAGAGVGVFRLRISDYALHYTRLVAVQNRRSIAAAVIADQYRPGRTRFATLTLEWRGDRKHRPRIESGSPNSGRTLAVHWMDTRMRVKFSPPVAVAKPLPVIRGARLDAETLQIIWRGRLPRQAKTDGTNAEPVVLFAFAIHLEERSSRITGSPKPLRTAEALPQSNDWYRLSWRSPDGVLEARFVNRLNAETIVERINGRLVPPAPIQGSVP